MALNASMRRAALAALLLVSALPASARATVADRLSDPALAARIDGTPLLAFSVDALWQQARWQDPQAPRTAVLEELVLNRLLAGAARKRYGEAVLFAGQRVGFTREVALDDQLAATLRGLYGKELEQALRRLPGANLDGIATPAPAPDAAALDAVFGAAGQLRLEFTLDAEHSARAAKLVLLRYQWPGGAGGKDGAITLLDVYRRQNVQGRVALFGRGHDFMLQQARQALAVMFTERWGRQQFGDAAIDDLRRVLADQAAARALQQLHGVGADIDEASPLLTELARQASKAEIEAYYRQHREEFLRIEKVRARHIRLADEHTAQQVQAALRKGADFATLARRYSTAPDGAGGGDLGWIRHQGKADWIAQLAFAQPEGQVSPPIRSAVGPFDKASWEIMLVEQRVEAYQPADSEAVRYVAANAIARDKALAQLAELRTGLLHSARIELNRQLIDQPLRALKMP